MINKKTGLLFVIGFFFSSLSAAASAPFFWVPYTVCFDSIGQIYFMPIHSYAGLVTPSAFHTTHIEAAKSCIDRSDMLGLDTLLAEHGEQILVSVLPGVHYGLVHYVAANPTLLWALDHILSFAGSREKRLLTYKIVKDYQALNNYGESPLHVAASFLNLGAVDLLIASKALIYVLDKKEQTPLYCLCKAIEGSSFESQVRVTHVIRSMLAHLPQNAQASSDESVTDIKKHFLNHSTKDGRTPLLEAIRAQSVPVVEELLQQGASVVHDQTGISALNEVDNWLRFFDTPALQKIKELLQIYELKERADLSEIDPGALDALAGRVDLLTIRDEKDLDAAVASTAQKPSYAEVVNAQSVYAQSLSGLVVGRRTRHRKRKPRATRALALATQEDCVDPVPTSKEEDVWVVVGPRGVRSLIKQEISLEEQKILGTNDDGAMAKDELFLEEEASETCAAADASDPEVKETTVISKVESINFEKEYKDALTKWNEDALFSLLKRKPNLIRIGDQSGKSALHHAVLRSAEKALKDFLSKYVKTASNPDKVLNKKDVSGKTAIEYATGSLRDILYRAGAFVVEAPVVEPVVKEMPKRRSRQQRLKELRERALRTQEDSKLCTVSYLPGERQSLIVSGSNDLIRSICERFSSAVRDSGKILEPLKYVYGLFSDRSYERIPVGSYTTMLESVFFLKSIKPENPEHFYNKFLAAFATTTDPDLSWLTLEKILCVDEHNLTLIHYLVMHDKLHELKKVLSKFSPEEKKELVSLITPTSKMCLLHFASDFNAGDVFMYLLENDAPYHVYDCFGRLPLMILAFKCYTKLFDALLLLYDRDHKDPLEDFYTPTPHTDSIAHMITKTPIAVMHMHSTKGRVFGKSHTYLSEDSTAPTEGEMSLWADYAYMLDRLMTHKSAAFVDRELINKRGLSPYGFLLQAEVCGFSKKPLGVFAYFCQILMSYGIKPTEADFAFDHDDCRAHINLVRLCQKMTKETQKFIETTLSLSIASYNSNNKDLIESINIVIAQLIDRLEKIDSTDSADIENLFDSSNGFLSNELINFFKELARDGNQAYLESFLKYAVSLELKYLCRYFISIIPYVDQSSAIDIIVLILCNGWQNLTFFNQKTNVLYRKSPVTLQLFIKFLEYTTQKNLPMLKAQLELLKSTAMTTTLPTYLKTIESFAHGQDGFDEIVEFVHRELATLDA